MNTASTLGHGTVKRIAILGSTGSIGQSALAVVDRHPDRFQIIGLSAGENVERLTEQISRYRPRIVTMASAAALERLRADRSLPPVAFAASGREGLAAVAAHPDVDVVLCASSGNDSLEAVLEAIDAGKTIALANKEVLVTGGAIVTESARRAGVAILPVDSEHNAIHQCLHGRSGGDVRRLILTASGGPFRGYSPEQLSLVTAAEALRHPTWQMGRKITIDSATMMNKGLEVIEAHWLFGVPAAQIDVVIHPQSVVHSMVELVDGSVIAQLGVTNMQLPIQYAFSYPQRWAAPVPGLDVTRAGPLEFFPPDQAAFPCLALAYRALANAQGFPVVLNAANEVAVAQFLEGRIGFGAIAEIVAAAMDAHTPREMGTIEAIRAVDQWARNVALDLAVEVQR